MANPDWKIKEWVSGRLPDFRVAEVALDGAPLPDFTYEIEAGDALPEYTVQFVAEDATPRPDYRISQYMGGGAPAGFEWLSDFEGNPLFDADGVRLYGAI